MLEFEHTATRKMFDKDLWQELLIALYDANTANEAESAVNFVFESNEFLEKL